MGYSSCPPIRFSIGLPDEISLDHQAISECIALKPLLAQIQLNDQGLTDNYIYQPRRWG